MDPPQVRTGLKPPPKELEILHVTRRLRKFPFGSKRKAFPFFLATAWLDGAFVWQEYSGGK
jgi:hypothetical protein